MFATTRYNKVVIHSVLVQYIICDGHRDHQNFSIQSRSLPLTIQNFSMCPNLLAHGLIINLTIQPVTAPDNLFLKKSQRWFNQHLKLFVNLLQKRMSIPASRFCRRLRASGGREERWRSARIEKDSRRALGSRS